MPQRRDATEEHGGRDDGEDLAREELLVRVEQEAPPRLGRDAARRLEEAVEAVPLEARLLLGVCRAEVRERLRRAERAVGVARVDEGAIERLVHFHVARVVGEPLVELGGIGRGRAAGDAGDVDLDVHAGARLLEIALELGDARLELLDAALERRHARVVRRLDGNEGVARLVAVALAHGDPIARLIRCLERLLEPAQAAPIEPERLRGFVEARALLRRDAMTPSSITSAKSDS